MPHQRNFSSPPNLATRWVYSLSKALLRVLAHLSALKRANRKLSYAG
jgi:hypothetical protein